MAYKNLPDLRFSGFSNNFKLLHIGDILKIKNGKSQKNVEVSEGKYPILGTGGIIGLTNSFLYDKESVLIGRKGTINKPMYMDTPFWTVDTLFYSEIKSNSDAKFVYFLFNTIEWLKYNTSTGVPSLTSTNIESIFVSIPEKIEQQKIGDFFTKLDKLIELQTQKVDQLKKLKRGYLQKMFPQEGETVPRLRFSGFSGEWKEDKIGRIIEVGSVYRIHQSDWTKEGIPFIRARDIVSYLKNGSFSRDRLYISKDKYEKLSEKNGIVKKGDVLVTGVGTIGKPFLISTNDPLYFKDGNIIWLKNNNIISPNFLFYIFLSPSVQKEIFSFSGVGTVGTYTIDSAKKTKIMLPINDEQQKIGSFFAKLDKLIEQQSNKLNQLKQQKKAYLQKMFI